MNPAWLYYAFAQKTLLELRYCAVELVMPSSKSDFIENRRNRSFFILLLGIIPDASEQPQAASTNQHPLKLGLQFSTSEPDQYHEVRLGANVRINALTAWRVFQAAMPRLHATSTAKSISGAMTTAQFHLPLLPACQRRRPVSAGWVPFAQLAVLINHPAQ